MTSGTDANDESTNSPLRGVVVGYDGSPTAMLAVDWAADAAAAYGLPLVLLRARPDAQGEVREVAIESSEAVALLGEVQAETLEAGLERVAARHPGVVVKAVVHPQAPVQSLLDASMTADLIVLGSRGLEGFRGLMLGSTTMNVTPHAHCPVVVLYQPDEESERARAAARHPREVVVGYDGSVSADLALSFALRHAQASGLGVAIVIVTKDRSTELSAEPVTQQTAGLSDAVHDLIHAAAGVVDTRPGVPVTYWHAHGRPAGVLIHEAAGAALVVVGARGRGGFAGLVLGSVGLQLLIHAECPVAVVHTTAHTV